MMMKMTNFLFQIIIAGFGLPWLGFSFGFLAAKILRQTSVDCIAISIETGIQNIGIAIFLLTFSLDQPMADMTSAVCKTYFIYFISINNLIFILTGSCCSCCNDPSSFDHMLFN